MHDDKENGQRELSEANEPPEQLVAAVREAIEDWVVEEEIAVQREGEEIVADEEALVENISIMVAIAVDEARD